MKKIQILCALLVIFFVRGSATAQPLDWEVPQFAIGIRANPDGAGITAKYFIIPQVSFEAMVNASGGKYSDYGPGTSFVGLVEYNFIFNNPSFRIFLGPGVHAASFRQYADIKEPRVSATGLDGIIGAEYVFTEVPIGISIDAKPAFNFYNGITAFPDNVFGLAVRYYFGRWSKETVENEHAVETGRGQ